MTARPLAPEADLAHVLQIARDALAAGNMIDPEELLCILYGCGPDVLPKILAPEPLVADRSQPPSPAREEVWQQAEAGTLAHLIDHGRPMCGSQDPGPWRTVPGATRCAACVDLLAVLARHG